jgi:hypothetical protein
MAATVDFLLMDGFDPSTGDLALRVGIKQSQDDGPRFLRLKLSLGHDKDPLIPLRRELSTHLRTQLPPLWEQGVKLIIHAIESDLAGPGGRDPATHMWVQTQIMHPSDERRCTLNHTIETQARVLYEWAEKMEYNKELGRAAELMERVLLLQPGNIYAVKRLSGLLRELGLIEECLELTEQWLRAEPEETEAIIRRAEALIYLGRLKEALAIFLKLSRSNPMHPMAHIGVAQAKSLLGGNPYSYLDAALALDRATTVAVLKETFDYRSVTHTDYDAVYSLEMLTGLLNVSHAEIKAFVNKYHMPLSLPDWSIHESELSRWVGIQNRYNLLPNVIHWSAPTPRRLPEIE